MIQDLKCFKGTAPCGPKPGLRRPMLLQSKAILTEMKPCTDDLKPEIDTDLLARELMKKALEEETKSAFENEMSDDEMDDDVRSLCGDSEEGDMVDLAYSFTKDALGQGMNIDFAKAIQDASQENGADFEDIADFEEDCGASDFEGDEHLENEESQEGLDHLHQAKQTLLCAAGDGRLQVALKAVAGTDEAMVESLRQEARDAMLKAASNGRLAFALKQMGTETKVSEATVEVPDKEEVKPVVNTTFTQRSVAQGARTVRLAWCMAGSPARSLRQKCMASLQAYPKSVNEQDKDLEHPEHPRLNGSASAISLSRGGRIRMSKSSSVGSLRPLKVKGPVLPPALPPTAFLHENRVKQKKLKQTN